MKFQIIAKEGYIEIRYNKEKMLIGCEFADLIRKAFEIADKTKKEVIIYEKKFKRE